MYAYETLRPCDVVLLHVQSAALLENAVESYSVEWLIVSFLLIMVNGQSM